MTEPNLGGCAVLIVQKDLPTALDLQDAFAESGARVLTSYRPARALLHAENSQISAAVIDASLDIDDRDAICKRLTTRNVPFVLYGHEQSTDGGRCMNSSERPIEAVERVAEIVRTSSSRRHDGRLRLNGSDIATRS